MYYFKMCIAAVLVPGLLTLTGGCQRILQQTPGTELTGKPAITVMCIVSYFQQDNAPYITEQQHAFNPKARYLQIIANEPTGLYKFTLNDGHFASSKQLTPFLSGLPASFVNQQLATALFYSFTAGADLLNTNQFATSENVKIEGRWYQSIQVPHPGEIQITLLRDLETERIELVKAENTALGTQWLLQSYNLRYSKDLNKLVPRKIDVFDIHNGLASKQLIIQIEYKGALKQEAQRASEQKIAGNESVRRTF